MQERDLGIRGEFWLKRVWTEKNLELEDFELDNEFPLYSVNNKL